MLVKEDIVDKFGYGYEVSIMGATTLMKNNFEVLKIYILWIKKVLRNGDFWEF